MFCFLRFIFISVFVFGILPCCDADDTVSQEVLDAWNRLEGNFKHLQGKLTTATTTTQGSNSSEVQGTIQFVCGPTSDHKYFVFDDRALVSNPDYLFELDRQDTSKPWSIVTIINRADSASQEELAAKIQTWKSYAAIWELPIGLVAVFDVLKSEDVALSEHEQETDNRLATSDGLLKLDYHQILEPPNHIYGGRRLIQNGTITVDAGSHLPVSYAINFELIPIDKGTLAAKGVSTGMIKYDESGSGLPVSVKKKDRYPDFAMVIERTNNFELNLNGRDVDPAQFRLSHFGFPEPEGMGPRRNYWFWGTLAFLGVALIAISVYLKRR